jgi:hypothetical protein
MTSKASIPFTTPVGRFLWGSLTRPKTKDSEGKPLLIKNGPDAGKPTQRYEFGLGIKKGAETHWDQTEWGALIKKAGVEGFPGGQHAMPTFAWKVTDGDSMIPNRKGRIPSTQEGFKGHWVVAFSSAFAPGTVNANGTAPVDPASIKVGHYMQVNGSVGGNGSLNQPGVYVNHRFVAHAAFGPEISQGPDASQAGFGNAALPPGASVTPIAALPTGQTPVAPSPAPAVVLAQPPQAPSAPVAPAPVVQPHTAFLTPTVAPPPPSSGPVMTEKAGGHTYSSMIANGWTHAQLIEHGYVKAA